ncbi:PIN domain-containing protein [Aggregatilineales bacterium SYSU G02658]
MGGTAAAQPTNGRLNVTAFVDTSVLIDVLRGHVAAREWYKDQNDLSVSVFVWFELLHGTQNQRDQQSCITFLLQFNLEMPQVADVHWAMEQLIRFRLSHNVSSADCLIAAACARTRAPLYTRNLKHMRPLLGDLAVNPY